jgi:hypothetical protein
VNLLEDNIDTINNITETLIDVSKQVGLEVNVEKTKYKVVTPSPECRPKSAHKTGNR